MTRGEPALPVALCLALALAAASPARATAPASPASPVRVGSKQFTESVIVAEVVAQSLQGAGVPAVHKRELGGTRVLWEALRAGQIDVYPEYTGTLAQELLPGEPDVPAALARLGLRQGRSLGFEDDYAIGMRRSEAARLGVRTLSDLARHPELPVAFSSEFLRRRDGWPRLREVYGFREEQARGMDHALAYRALREGAIAATDLYSTDAEIRASDLIVLADDRGAFPRYECVLVWRADVPAAAVPVLARLEQTIDVNAMIGLNARALIDHVPEDRVAGDFLRRAPVAADTLVRRVARRTAEHLVLVLLSLAAAIVVAIPLGILATRRRRLGQLVLASAGVLQTIPSLALLVFLIPVLGIGTLPAVVALFLYGLLPIVRGTHAGLAGIPLELRESAQALGLPKGAALRRIELPLAARSILAGIKTAAVIDVGTATIGALIGAGGYGQPILAGIRLASTPLILEGAIPAALLALAVQGMFELLERRVVTGG